MGTRGVSASASGVAGTSKVSANDTTEGYLATKLVAGPNVTLTENNDGFNETLTIEAAGGAGAEISTALNFTGTTSSNVFTDIYTVGAAPVRLDLSSLSLHCSGSGDDLELEIGSTLIKLIPTSGVNVDLPPISSTQQQIGGVGSLISPIPANVTIEIYTHGILISSLTSADLNIIIPEVWSLLSGDIIRYRSSNDNFGVSITVCGLITEL